MEIPPEPPEQAGRSLYQRLEISGMRDQLVRRVNDVKKNLTASQRNLDLLRERVEVESQNKSFQMSLELEKNTKQLCALQVSNGDALRSLRVLQTIFAGMIAFDFLDRVTGEWSVVDGGWMSEFFDTVIKENILLWFAVSMAAWALAALFISKRTFLLNWRSRGTTKLNISMNRKIDTAKLRDLVGEKEKTTEERRYEGKRQIVKVVYNEPPSNDWGGATPSVTLEYDDNNSILLEMVIDYNRRDARKDSVLSADELKQKMMHEYDNKSIFVGADQSLRDYDLAIDKRRSILKTDMKSVKFKEL
jgi:WD repeat-containing protein 35